MHPGRNRQISFALFIALQLALFWRLADFVDEFSSGALKMSLGSYLVEGFYALVAQALIIVILLLITYRMRVWHSCRKRGH